MYDVEHKQVANSLRGPWTVEVTLSNWQGRASQSMTPEQAHALGVQLQRVARLAIKEQERLQQEAANELNRLEKERG